MSIIYHRLIRKLLCLKLKYEVKNVCIGYKKNRTIFLTFDDGPHEIHTVEILELLKQYEIKSTFFAVGNVLTKHKQIGKRIVEEGHVLGNHTYSHRLFPFISQDEKEDEIFRCQNMIDEVQESSIRLFRPPQGLMGIRDVFFLKMHKITPCLWTIDSGDYLKNDPEIIVNRLMRVVCGDSVILFHDDSSLAAVVLKDLLPYWKSTGYEFRVYAGGCV